MKGDPDAGPWPLPDPPEPTPATQPDEDEYRRRLVLTPASEIRPRRVQWLWDGRLALGTLALLAGREGMGKSTLAYWLGAQITRGTLPGELHGRPRAVLVCATEDSWEHTIVPRLMAAEAELQLVYRVEIAVEDIHVGLRLPRDLTAMKDAAAQTGAALLLLDPLMSRLEDRLDTHRDGDVRRALEPMVAAADVAGITVLGLIHHNKSDSTDPLQLVMASKAFTAVARSVHTVVPDPNDDTGARRLFGTPKNNLGRSDLPTLSYAIDSYPVETDDGDLAWTGRLQWGAESPVSIGDAMRTAIETPDQKSATTEAAEWLEDYVTVHGGAVPSTEAKRAGIQAGHSQDSVKRARQRLGYKIESSGFPRRTYWVHPSESETASPVGATVGATPRGESPTALTALTDAQAVQSEQSEQSEQSQGHGGKPAPTADPTEPPRRQPPLPDRPLLVRGGDFGECACGRQLTGYTSRRSGVCRTCANDARRKTA